MGKTSKSSQSAATADLLRIQPSPCGAGPTTPTPAPITIKREHVPEIVFVAEASATDNGFIASANSFHNFFGFRGAKRKTFTSIQHLVQLLAAATTPLSRIRIVAHADNTGIYSPFVQDAERLTIDKTDLRKFLEGDGAWLLSILRLVHLLGTGSAATQAATAILSHLSQNATHSATVAPLGSSQISNPNTVLVNFILCAATRLMINGNKVKRNGANLTAAQKTTFNTAYDKILDLQMQNVAGSGSFTGVTATQLSAIATAVRGVSFAQYNIVPGDYDFPAATVDLLTLCVRALNNNFRQNLTTAQQRFTTSSWIDIRGCRAGTDRDYLTAISEFFGRPSNRPHVSGPTWYQMFPGIGYVDSPNATSMDDVLNNGVAGTSASAFKSALDEWLTAIRYDATYFNAWHTAFNSNAATFCLLNWRASIPATFMIRGGKQHEISSLNFIDTIKRVKSIFDVATGSQPTQAVLNTLQTFVTNDLPGYMQQLTQAVPAAGPYTTLFNALKSISDTLSASVIPGTAPSGLTQTQVQQYQTDLINFISTNKLQRIHELLQTAKTRVNSPNGKYHLYLLFGLPGVVAFPAQFLNSRVFVFSSERNNALRIFLREMWEEPLPTPNGVTAAVLDNDHPAHRAISALTDDHANTTIHLAPMPNYFDHIETI